MSPIIQMAPKRVLSSIPEGDEEKDNRIETLRRKYRKALNPTPIEGIDVGDSEEVLDPQIRIPDQSDFELPPPLQDIVDQSNARFFCLFLWLCILLISMLHCVGECCQSYSGPYRVLHSITVNYNSNTCVVYK